MFARLATSEDCQIIEGRLKRHEKPIWSSDTQISRLIEQSTLSVVCEVNDTIVAFASFDDIIDDDKLTTIRLNYCVSSDSIFKNGLNSIFKFVFSELHLVTKILVVIPVVESEFFGRCNFSLLHDYTETDSTLMLQLKKEELIPEIFVRPALVEDHDDLSPLFQSQQFSLEEKYGEFYLADLVDDQSEGNHSLVGEVKGKAVGLMSVAGDVDLELLQQCFDLMPFDNLIKVEQPPESPHEPGDWVAFIKDEGAWEQIQSHFERLLLTQGVVLRMMDSPNEDDDDETKVPIKGLPLEAIITMLNDLGETWQYLPENEDKMGEAIAKHCGLDMFAEIPSAEPEEGENADGEVEPVVVSDNEPVHLAWDNFMDVLKTVTESIFSERRRELLWGWVLENVDDVDPTDGECWMIRDAFLNAGRKAMAENNNEDGEEEQEDGTETTDSRASLSTASLQPKDEMSLLSECTISSSAFIDSCQELWSNKGFSPELGELLLATLGRPTNGELPKEDEEEEEIDLSWNWQQLSERWSVIRNRIENETKRRVIIAGPAGSGKSTLGVQLAADLRTQFVDASQLDEQELLEQLCSIDVVDGGYVLEVDPGLAHSFCRCLSAVFAPSCILMLDADDDTLLSRGGENAPPQPEALESFRLVREELFLLPPSSRPLSREIRTNNMDGVLQDARAAIESVRAAKESEIPEEVEDGAPVINAFAMTLFCINPKYSLNDWDFIRQAFALYPQCDYCIITLPHSVEEPEIMKYFLPVSPSPSSTFSHALYLCHRQSLMTGDLSIRLLEKDDCENVAMLVNDDEFSLYDVRKLVREPSPRPKDMSLVIEHPNGGIVGFCQLDKPSTTEEFEEHFARFDIDPFISRAYHPISKSCYLKRLSINPAFHASQATFLRKSLHKFDGRNSVHYVTETEDFSTIVASIFRPIEQRALPDFHDKESPVNTPEYDESAYVAIPRTLISPRRRINHRIVVTGSSITAQHFLRQLVMLPTVEFSNVTWLTDVIPESLATDGSMPHVVDSQNILRGIQLSNRVRIVDGSVVEIDREKQIVVLRQGSSDGSPFVPISSEQDESILPYDQLILCPSTIDSTFRKVNLPADGIPSLQNSFHSLGTENSIERLTELLEADQCDTTNIIVYGCDLRALSILDTLLAFVPAKNIKVIRPSSGLVFGMSDPIIQQHFDQCLRDSGISCQFGEVLESVSCNFGRIEQVVFRVQNDNSHVRLPCSLLICAHESELSQEMFNAINDCGLVYDGGLVVDPNFCTSDSKIMAACKITKFSRHFGAQPPHDVYSEEELADILFEKFIKIIDPQDSNKLEMGSQEELHDLHASPSGDEIPLFLKPIHITCRLPKEKFFFYSSLPNEAFIDTTVNHVETNKNGSLSRITIDAHGIIVTVACISDRQLPVRNLNRIVGKHHSYVGNLLRAAETGRLEDFIEYIKADWTTALFLNRFKSFSNELKAYAVHPLLRDLELMAKQGALDGMGYDQIQQKVAGAVGVNGANLPTELQESIQQIVVQYLKENKIILPSFFIPDL
eukprot:TRINITY_DN6361_c0_g1_i1.p1 TRINITY_DN6361_c0_g1~~TRINITY_DN6361_c0_g1_i1.p1  ORF type:complete len:1531 (+),score=538.46 TRINITY_DN6361_c0_g1_i1:383-4975(+)